MTRIEATIRDYIQQSFLDGGGAAPGYLRGDEDLLTLLDSLQILRMLMDLEAQFDIKVDNSELTPENLGTIERLAAFIHKKQLDSAYKSLTP
ncbi:MAG: acyl carrier protein [Planctomycetaceae bacterium]|nr:acyl carrier protein [Planctomycetaceae bacterium]